MDALKLKIGLCIQHAVVDQVLVGNRLLVAVVVTGRAVTAIKQFKSVVINVVSGGRCQPELDGVEVIEDGLISLVDRTVAFIGHDQIVVTHRQARKNLHHAGVGRELNACTGGFAGLDAGQTLVG
ncbi:hypothetical protein D9M68_747190 [compost metagenome]